jgi:hypothetical protein
VTIVRPAADKLTPPVIAFGVGGAVADAPERVIVSPAVLAGWTRRRLAVRHCPGHPAPAEAAKLPCSNPWDGRCQGHPDPHTVAGDRIVVGEKAAGPRAVYTVRAVGTAGIRLTREA